MFDRIIRNLTQNGKNETVDNQGKSSLDELAENSQILDKDKMYVNYPALWRNAFSQDGYEWISGDDTENSVVSFLRKGNETDKVLLVVCHFQANAMEQYSVGVPSGGTWKEVLNSDDKKYGGSGMINGDLKAVKKESHGQDYSVSFKLAPLAVMIFEGNPGKPKVAEKTKTKAIVAGKKNK